MNLKLLRKYDVAAPRYTSYPPVPFWNKSFSTTTWIQELSDNNDEGIDLYIHIPFCQQLCYYCGCHRIITKNRSKGREYINSVVKEWKLYSSKVDLKIASIHFGGGTPNFLENEDWEFLLESLKPSFSENFIGSVEVDPRTLEDKQLELLSAYGFKRLSMGVQDFDNDVQVAINRIQTFDKVKEVTESAKAFGFDSINMDLIYGLPLQTPESILETIAKVEELKPNMIAWYSYAHLPDRLKNQKILEQYPMAKGEEKRELYDLGREKLLHTGYVEIGLDHFALEGSYLAKAYEAGKLKRSFMGYTDKKEKVTLGLGVSSISQSPGYFVQNEKEVAAYQEKIDGSELPLTNGHKMNKNDSIIDEEIQSLMCSSKMDLNNLKNHPFRKEILKNLDEFVQDGIILLSDDCLEVTGQGRPFLRNIAMVFDEYLRNGTTQIKFSQSI